MNKYKVTTSGHYPRQFTVEAAKLEMNGDYAVFMVNGSIICSILKPECIVMKGAVVEDVKS